MLGGLKEAALITARTSGLFRWVGASRWRQQRLLILCYHGISLDDEHEWDPLLYISPEMFEERLQAIERARMNVLPLDRAVKLLNEGELPPRSVVITFDDGFYDFSAKALPLLERFGYPSLLYLTTYYCLHPRPIFRLSLSYLLWKGRSVGTLNLRQLVGCDESVNIQEAESRGRLVNRLYDDAAQKQLSPDEKNDLLRRLAELLGLSFDDFYRRRTLQLMTPAEVAAAKESGVEIELHTHRHRTPNDRALFRRELEDNSCAIQHLTGHRAVHFCYPSGVVKANFVPWLRDFGVKSATTCERGLASASSERLLLPRVLDDCQMTPTVFEGWLTGFNALVRGL